MFSNWFNVNGTTSNDKNKQIDLDAIIEQLLKIIKYQLSEQLGQQIGDDKLQSMKENIFTVKRLQQSLVQIKAKYHDIVDKLTHFQQSNKKISTSITNFILMIKNQLQSDQILIPMKQIQKGICQFIPDRVEKQLNYLTKIYQTSFQDLVKRKVIERYEQVADKIKQLENLNKNLQNELFTTKNTKSLIEKKNLQLTFKLTQLMQKNSSLQKQQKITVQQTDLKQKFKTKQNEYIQQLKTNQKQKNKLLQKIAQNQQQILKFETLLEKTREKNEQNLQQVRQQIKKKQGMYEISIKKNHQEKKQYQQTIQNLKEQLEMVKEQNQKLNSKHIYISVGGDNGDNKLQDQINILQKQKKLLECIINQAVNKEILKELFVKFDDQSIQWTIRRDLRKQIHSHLGIKNNQNKENKEEESSKKWFGIF